MIRDFVGGRVRIVVLLLLTMLQPLLFFIGLSAISNPLSLIFFNDRRSTRRVIKVTMEEQSGPYTHVQFDTTVGTFVIELYYR